MKIGGFQKFSMIDYPQKLAAIVFTVGCNFRCGYCHNPELINNPPQIIDQKEILDFLKTREGKLDGVVVTGGEPCLQPNLLEFIKEVKDLGFLVKLDTNGSCPDVIELGLKEKLLDYIAMDIKAPFCKYNEIINSNVKIDEIKKSIFLIQNSSIDYEFRTTIVKEDLSKEDLLKIAESISCAKSWVLQKFIPSKHIDDNFKNKTAYTDKEMTEIKEELLPFVKNIILR